MARSSWSVRSSSFFSVALMSLRSRLRLWMSVLVARTSIAFARSSFVAVSVLVARVETTLSKYSLVSSMDVRVNALECVLGFAAFVVPYTFSFRGGLDKFRARQVQTARGKLGGGPESNYQSR